MHLIGLISDTHGSLDAVVHELFEGVDAIIHAGDVGGEEILYELQAIAPVTVVCGNTDHSTSSWPLPQSAWLNAEGIRVFVAHDRDSAVLPKRGEADVWVFGHTHKPEVKQGKRALEINPGSASRPREKGQGRTIGLLRIESGHASARIESF